MRWKENCSSTSIDDSLDCPASKVEVVGTEARYLSDEGRILGLDIGPEMLEQTQRQCRQLCHGTFKKWRGEEPLPYQEAFDRLSISFALDSFAQEVCFLTLIFV